MAHVNLLKQVKIDDRWVLRSIPKKANGQRDWSAWPDGNYFIEFREKGKRRRLPAGATVAQVLEVQRRKRAELEAVAFGIIVPRPRTEDLPKPVLIDGRSRSLSGPDRNPEEAQHLSQIQRGPEA